MQGLMILKLSNRQRTKNKEKNLNLEVLYRSRARENYGIDEHYGMI